MTHMSPDNDIFNDGINKPAHYTFGKVECIDAIEGSMREESFVGFLKGNVMKYIWRFQDKDDPLKDLKKCEWYLHKLIEYYEN